MSNRETILQDWFEFEEHPFRPTRDPATKFDFVSKNVSLFVPLDVFTYNELDRFYIRTWDYGSLVKRVDTSLTTLRFPAIGGQPPVTVIEGPKDAGRSSLARYVAYLLQQRHPSGVKTSLRAVDVQGENLGRLLWKVKNHVKSVASPRPGSDVAQAFDTWANDGGPIDPQEQVLKDLFADLATVMQGAAPLVLIIEPITVATRDWPSRLTSLLLPINVAPIFVTDSAVVSSIITSKLPNSILLQLRPLPRKECDSFLEERLKVLRRRAPAAKRQGIFPFRADAVDRAYAGSPDGRGLRMLLDTLDRALDKKMTELDTLCTRLGGASAARATLTDNDLLVYASHVEAAMKDLVESTAARRIGGTQ